MHNMKIVFISGPYFGDGKWDTIEKNIRNAEKYQIALISRGVGVFCAHNHTEHFDSKGVDQPEKFYHDLDMEFLKRACDAVIAIPGWKNSRGALKEIKWAKENNVKIFYLKDITQVDRVIKWVNKKT